MSVGWKAKAELTMTRLPTKIERVNTMVAMLGLCVVCCGCGLIVGFAIPPFTSEGIGTFHARCQVATSAALFR